MSLRDQALKPYTVTDLDKRVSQAHNVQERSRIDDPLAQGITDIDNISTLLKHLRSGKYTAEQVIRAYICEWQLNKKKIALQQKYLNRWSATQSSSGKPVDVLLGPTTPHTAVRHRTLRWVGYTKVWNLLDYPVVTFPVDEVRKEVDMQPKDYQLRNDLDVWNWVLYDPNAMNGQPANLQVIGKKLNDEKVLGAATIIEKIWRG